MDVKKLTKPLRHEEKAGRIGILEAEDAGYKELIKQHVSTFPRRQPLHQKTGAEKNSQQGSTPSCAKRPPFELTEKLKEKLLPHQHVGVKWLIERHWEGKGCVLADEMGLGKTVQVSSFLGLALRSSVITTAIVSCPTTLFSVWERALEAWTELNCSAAVTLISSDTSTVKRQAMWRRKLKSRSASIVITSHGLIKNDLATIADCGGADYLVIDEAQTIRSASTEVAKAAFALPSRHRIAVTGTPLMNSFSDIWSIMHFVDPSILPESQTEFKSISAELMRNNERGENRAMADAKLANIQERIAPYILRREKDSIKEMQSKKTDVVVWVKMCEEQTAHYRQFVSSEEVQFGLKNIRHHPLTLLSTLKRICDHTWLNLQIESFREAMSLDVGDPFEHYGAINSSGKLDAAIQLILSHVEEKRKTLVFSQSKRLLHILETLLNFMGIGMKKVTGDVPFGDRANIVAEFDNPEEPTPVCLLTTQVGGLGLTFNHASRVILLDPCWNPSTDAQAVDRVHRIGQKQDVVTYRLITCGTVEEKCYRLQIHKMAAAKQISQGKTATHKYFTNVQLHSMFEVEEGSLESSTTAWQLAEVHPGSEPTVLKDWLLENIPNVVGVSNHQAVFSTDPDDAEAVRTTLHRETKRANKLQMLRSQIAAPRQKVDVAIDEVAEEMLSQRVALSEAETVRMSTHRDSVNLIQSAAEIRNSCFVSPCRRSTHVDPVDAADDLADICSTAIAFRGFKIPKLNLDEVGRLSLAIDEDEEDGSDGEYEGTAGQHELGEAQSEAVAWDMLDALGQDEAEDPPYESRRAMRIPSLLNSTNVSNFPSPMSATSVIDHD